MSKLYSIIGYVLKNYIITLILLLVGILSFLALFYWGVTDQFKTTNWDRYFDPAFTLLGITAPFLIWLYFISREWRASLDEKLIVHFTLPSSYQSVRNYVMSCYNVNVLPDADIRQLGQQIGQQMSKTQFLKFNPSIQTIGKGVTEIKNKANKSAWVRYQEIEFLLDSEPEDNNKKRPLAGKYVIWNLFEEQKLQLEMKYRPMLPWNEEFQNKMNIANLLSIDKFSKETFEKYKSLEIFKKGTLFLINSPICTDYGQFDYCAIDIDNAKLLIKDTQKIKSAIGHEGTAKYLSILLGKKITVKRTEITMQPGDQAITIKIPRQSIGADLSKADLADLKPTLGLLKRIL